MFNNKNLIIMSAKKIQLSKNGVNLYPQTIDQAIAVVAKGKLLSTVLAELGAEDLRLAGLIQAAEEKIAILNGSAEGSVDKKIADAIDAFATKVTDDETINTVKELFDYVAEHGSEFSALLGRVSTNETNISGLQGKVATLEGDNTTNKQNIAGNTEAINGLNTKVGSSADGASYDGSLYARVAQLKADLEALGGEDGSVSEQIDAKIEAYNTSTVAPIAADVNTIKGDYLKGSDKSELQGKIDEKVAQSAYDTKMQSVDSLIAANAAAASAADAKGAQGISDAAAAKNRADAAYTLAEGKIDYVEVGDTTYPDFNEIVTA